MQENISNIGKQYDSYMCIVIFYTFFWRFYRKKFRKLSENLVTTDEIVKLYFRMGSGCTNDAKYTVN